MSSNAGSIFGNGGNASSNPPAAQPASAQPGQAPGNANSPLLAETAPAGNPPVGKHESQDENNALTEPEQVESLQAGAAQQSRPAQVASGNPPFGEASEPVAEASFVEFTSHPINRFRLGRFQFERGVLRLEDGSDDLARFEKVLAGASPRDKALVKRAGDTAAADAVARRFLKDSTMRAGIDTSEPKPGEPR